MFCSPSGSHQAFSSSTNLIILLPSAHARLLSSNMIYLSNSWSSFHFLPLLIIFRKLCWHTLLTKKLVNLILSLQQIRFVVVSLNWKTHTFSVFYSFLLFGTLNSLDNHVPVHFKKKPDNHTQTYFFSFATKPATSVNLIAPSTWKLLFFFCFSTPFFVNSDLLSFSFFLSCYIVSSLFSFITSLYWTPYFCPVPSWRKTLSPGTLMFYFSNLPLFYYLFPQDSHVTEFIFSLGSSCSNLKTSAPQSLSCLYLLKHTHTHNMIYFTYYLFR